MLLLLFPLVTCLFNHPLLATVIGTVLVTSLMYIRAVLNVQEEPPKLHYKDSDLAKYIIRKCQRLTKPPQMPVYVRNGHIQTLLPKILLQPYFQFDRQYLEMKDGGTVALDWSYLSSQKLKKTCPVMVLLPGNTDGATSFSFLCKRAMERGMRCVVVNKRGHGNSPLTTPKLASLGDPSDLRQVVKYIHNIYPCAKLVAIGSSTGSELLLSYLGEYGSSSYLSVGVCISPSYDIEELYNGGLSKLYEWIFLFNLKKLVCQHAPALSKIVSITDVLGANKMVDFLDKLYGKLYGYESISQYWERNNPIGDVDDIAIPVMCINALDDPVCQTSSIPFELFRAYPNFMLVTTKHGGHGGFLHRSALEPWADKMALDYVTVVLDFMQKYDRH